jgi:hypothetical protein
LTFVGAIGDGVFRVGFCVVIHFVFGRLDVFPFLVEVAEGGGDGF